MRFPVLRTLTVLVLAAAIIGLTMSSAIKRDMDHVIAVSEDELTAITISLSRSVYHIPFGYVGLKQVYDRLHEHWNRGAQGWNDVARLRANYRDRALLNAGIRAAASLEAPTPGFISDGGLISMNSRDIGQVDYVSIAFRLFGPQIGSLFYLYFAIVALSAFVFVMTFRENIYALAVLLATLAAYYIELRLAVFDPVAMPTYFGMQHGATMSLVAMWHFVFLLVSRRRPTAWVLLGTLVQLAVLILAWRMRGTTAWIFLLLIVLALAAAGPYLRVRPLFRLRFRATPFGQLARNLRRSTLVAAKSTLPFAENALRWPVVVLIAGLAGNALYNSASLHPVYATDDVMAGRGIWSDAYLGLARHDPQLLGSRVAGLAIARLAGDELRWWAARDYMDRIRLARWDGRADLSLPAPGLRSEWAGVGLRAPFHDRMAQGAFVAAVKSGPVRTLRVYLVQKPREIVRAVKKSFSPSGKKGRFALSLVVAAALVGGLAAQVRRGEDAGATGQTIGLVGGAFLAALLPIMWGYPTHATVADSVLLLVAFLPIVLGLGAIWALRNR